MPYCKFHVGFYIAFGYQRRGRALEGPFLFSFSFSFSFQFQFEKSNQNHINIFVYLQKTKPNESHTQKNLERKLVNESRIKLKKREI